MEIIRTVRNNDSLFFGSLSENIEDLMSLMIKNKRDARVEIEKNKQLTKEINDVADTIDTMINNVVRSNKPIMCSSHFDEKYAKYINDNIKDYKDVVNYRLNKSTSLKGGIDCIVWTKES